MEVAATPTTTTRARKVPKEFLPVQSLSRTSLPVRSNTATLFQHLSSSPSCRRRRPIMRGQLVARIATTIQRVFRFLLIISIRIITTMSTSSASAQSIFSNMIKHDQQSQAALPRLEPRLFRPEVPGCKLHGYVSASFKISIFVIS